MKVGLSLSKCVADILNGEVDSKDVLVIVTRTNFDPHYDAHWNEIWRGYTSRAVFNTAGKWSQFQSREHEVRNRVLELYDRGRIHQPRQFNLGYPPRVEYHWLETFVSGEENSNPAVKKAWDNYKILAGLS